MSEHLPEAAARARLRQILDEINDLGGDSARLLYRLGVLLREVETSELWRLGGHASFHAWVEDEANLARSSAHRALTVVRHFNEDIAVRYGFDKLYQGLRYMQLTQRAEQPGDLIALDLRLRDARGRYVSVPFHEATVPQIQDAIRGLAGRRGRQDALEDGLDARLSRLEAAMPAPASGLRPVKQRVETVRTRSGELSLSFRQIPLRELPAFIEALRKMLDEG